MVITLCGPNSYEMHAALKVLMMAFVKEHTAQAVEQLEGSELTPMSLRQHVTALSLFAPVRFVAVKNPSANKELFAALEEIVAVVPEEVTLVIVDNNLDKRTKTYKMLKAKTDFREFASLGDAQLTTWAGKFVADRGGVMTSGVAREMVSRIGNDQWQLASELEKLIAFDPHITEDNVQKLVTPTLQTSAFALLDAALAGRTKLAQQLLRDLRTQSDPYEFFGLLVWQATALALVVSAPKMTATELAAATGLKPFVLQKSSQLAQKLGPVKVRQIIETLADIDVQLKSSGIDPWILLEQAVGKIT